MVLLLPSFLRFPLVRMMSLIRLERLLDQDRVFLHFNDVFIRLVNKFFGLNFWFRLGLNLPIQNIRTGLILTWYLTLKTVCIGVNDLWFITLYNLIRIRIQYLLIYWTEWKSNNRCAYLIAGMHSSDFYGKFGCSNIRRGCFRYD